jgi:quercetin dioxygenase-like cupin family protein
MAQKNEVLSKAEKIFEECIFLIKKLKFTRKYFMRVFKILALLFLNFFITAAYADVLLETSSTWEGGKIIYPKGEPEITSVILTVDEGEVTPFHCHPVPTLGYILQGSLEVETKSGKKVRFNKGESVVEVMRTVHRGHAINGPVEVVVFYVGEQSTPNTVLPDNDPESIYCDP